MVKLGDFGIAKILDGTLEQAKTMVGTPYYISPEIVKGKPYSFKTDVWSLGIILHELSSLEVPINANNLHNLYLKITDAKTQVRPIPSRYSTPMRSLVNRCLTKDPAK